MRDNDLQILEVQNISNHYDGKPLLQNVSFSLQKGEILCLLGPSGSGKTTLLRLLAGLEQEEAGTIFFRGQDVKPIPPHKRKIGMMFQEYALFPHKSVKENIAFGLEMQKCPATLQEQKVNFMLDLVGLTTFSQRRIDDLSGGERQRVALARSLAPEPQLLLLDEPLGSLDRTLRDRLTGEIRSILKTLGVTAVFVTHDQAEAFSVADKIAVLNNGILQQFDTPENVYRRPSSITVAKFLGFSNFLEGEVDNAGLFRPYQQEIDAIDLNSSVSEPLKRCTLLLRPEGAMLADQGSSSEDSGAILTGIVSSSRFLGNSYRLTVTIGRTVFTFDLPIDPRPPQVDEPITLRVRSSSLVIIGDTLTDNSQLL